VKKKSQRKTTKRETKKDRVCSPILFSYAFPFGQNSALNSRLNPGTIMYRECKEKEKADRYCAEICVENRDEESLLCVAVDKYARLCPSEV
jgi:hypothetical protein